MIPSDRRWEARATALRRETPALAMLAAVLAVLAAFLAWIVVLVPGPGSARGSPVFWLLAVPLMAWTGLTGRLAPDFMTIADFRRDNGPAVKATCRQFVLLCRKLGLFSDSLVAVDGGKFKA